MVNHHLREFANDPVFQQQLQNPKVKLALDLWGGSKDESHHTAEEIDEVRRDPVVRQGTRANPDPNPIPNFHQTKLRPNQTNLNQTPTPSLTPFLTPSLTSTKSNQTKPQPQLNPI